MAKPKNAEGPPPQKPPKVYAYYPALAYESGMIAWQDKHGYASEETALKIAKDAAGRFPASMKLNPTTTTKAAK